MFSFFRGTTSKVVEPLERGESASEWSDLSLENGSNYDNSRRSFSQPRTTEGSFVGNGSSYPPKYNDEQLRKGSHSSNGYPSLRSTFTKLETYLSHHAPSLQDALLPPLLPTSQALQSLIDAIHPYKLPRAVLDSYQIHNGQDIFAFGHKSQGGSGLFFGLDWMSIEQVESEYLIWRKFEKQGGLTGMEDHFSTQTFDQPNGNGQPHPYSLEDGQFDDDEGMRSFPLGWVRMKYSHPGWLPLLTDRAGNYIGVDLDPPPPLSATSLASSSKTRIPQTTFGQPGQVIAFGREVDEKVVLFPGDSAGGWGRFLAAFVEDLERGEFARLTDDNEEDRNDRARTRAGQQSGSDGSDEDWNQEDGLGDAGYLDGARYGDEGEMNENSGGAGDGRSWTLRSEYRRWLSEHNDQGGVIGAIAERSRRKWRLVGIDAPSSNQASLSLPPSTIQGARMPLSVTVPMREEIEEGPFSSVTERGGIKSPNLMETESPGLENVDDPLMAATELSHPLAELDASPIRNGMSTRSASSSVSLVLSPPSPTRQRFDSVDPQTSSHSGSPEQDRRSQHEPRQPLSPDFLNDGRQDRQRSLGKQTPRRRAPPPPCSIELPTFEDLNFGEDLNTRTSQERPRSSSLTDRDYLSSERNSAGRRQTPSPKMDANILPLSTSHKNDSRTSLVRSGAGINSIRMDNHPSQDLFTSIDGLGITSPFSSTFGSNEHDRVERREAVVVEIDANVERGAKGKSPILHSDLPYESMIGR